MPLSYSEYCDAVQAAAWAFATMAQSIGPDRAVPTCPGWTAADLIKHHGLSERRVEYVVRTRSQDRILSSAFGVDLPDDPSQYAVWFASGVAPLIATLRTADPTAPVWTNGVDQHVRYWARRILFEAVIHGNDAARAMGIEHRIGAEIAIDGIDEFLTNLMCFPWVAERIRAMHRPGQSIQLRTSDGEHSWRMVLDDDGFAWRRDDASSSVAVTGGAPDLLLLVYGRVSLAETSFRVSGDVDVLADWLERTKL